MPAEPSQPRMVHLGLGAFMRAFGIPWIAEADPGFPVIGVAMNNRQLRDDLAAQDHAYHTVEQGAERETIRRITSLSQVLVAADEPDAVVTAMSDPATVLITLTITEKGYCHDPATWRLDPDHPGLRSEVNALSLILRALRRRANDGAGPITILSCDNLPGNGKVLAAVLQDLADRDDPGLGPWISENVAFPSSMVDRIVPATTPEKLAHLRKAHGIDDPAAVFHEPFRQWVIERKFATQLPDFGAAGVTIADDVAPFEHMKLRLLNGAHSALAYLGHIDGRETIADAMGAMPIRHFIRRLWAETIIPATNGPEGVDLSDYAAALEQRFVNPQTRHLTWQVAMDGSQKLPQRFGGVLRWHMEHGGNLSDLAMVMAAWVYYVSGRTCAGDAIDLRDPLAERLAAAHADAAGPEQAVSNVLGCLDMIGPYADTFLPRVTLFYRNLLADGVGPTLEDTFT